MKKRTKGKTALIVEAGDMRGIFAAGVLDALSMNMFNPFDLYLSASFGSILLSSFIAKQEQRNFNIYIRHMASQEFTGMKRFFKKGLWFDFEWLWKRLEIYEPLDEEAFFRNIKKQGSKFVAVCTSAVTGQAVYMEPEPENLSHVLKASCAQPAEIENLERSGPPVLVDGSIADPIPIVEAYTRGARRIMIIRTRSFKDFRERGIESLANSLTLKGSYTLRLAVKRRSDAFSRAMDFMKNQPDDSEIIEIAPPAHLETGSHSRNLKALQADYQLGVGFGTAVISGLSW